MASDGDFDSEFSHIPPFPGDVPTAPLLRLSLSKLLDADPVESNRLWDACCELGFFYLDVRGAKAGNEVDGDVLIEEVDNLFNIADDFFSLPVSEKVKYDLKDQGSYFGYKGYGDGIIDKEGRRDRNEFYNISKDDILGVSDRVLAPQVLDQHRPLFHSYIRRSHAVVILILRLLDRHLNLPPNTLPSLHRLDRISGDQIRFVKSPPQPLTDRQAALGAHTDFGSVTLLWNQLGGLQILPPGQGAEQNSSWVYVKPLRGCCVVNLGDALVKMTRGVLRSNLHRVVNPPGKQQQSTRFSLVYFSRPEDDVVLRTLKNSDIIDQVKLTDDEEEEEEEEITSKDWILRRALGRRGVGDWKNSEGTESMRGMRQIQTMGFGITQDHEPIEIE